MKNDLRKLANRIIEVGKEKKAPTGKDLFLLSFRFKKMDLRPETGKKVIKFLSELKKSGVYFKVTKPLPKCLFTDDYEKSIKNFNIPRSCFECLELFTVHDKKLRLCNGKEYNFRDFKEREEIYEKLLQQRKINPGCKLCIYRIRKQCSACLSCS